jgi:hypothetical protein
MSNIIDKIQVSGVTYDIGGSGGGNPTVELTQAEYDALVTAGTVSADTYYIITDAQAGDLTNYYTKTETNTLLGGKADTATTYTKTETDNLVTAATSTKQDTLVSGTNIKTINNESLLGSGNIDIQGGSSYTAGDGIDITNDAISVTGKVDTSTYSTYTAVTDTALASKQTTLTAGTGISIIDNVISATGGMTEDDELLLATALTDLNDRKIDASEVKSNYQKKGDYVTTNTLNTRLAEYETALDEQNVEEVTAYALNDLNDRFGGLKIVKITESEYAALATKDENTLYIVVADPS